MLIKGSFLSVVVLGAFPVLAGEKGGQQETEAREMEALVKALDTGDASARTTAEISIRVAGKKALPALRRAKMANAESHERWRHVLMDLSIEYTTETADDVAKLARLCREEAEAGRYEIAARGYKRVQVLYARMKARTKDIVKANRYQRAMILARDRHHKALRLAREEGHKLSRWGHAPDVPRVWDGEEW